MPTTPDEFLRYAAEAMRWALKADNERDRMALTELARTWTAAAISAEGKTAKRAA